MAQQDGFTGGLQFGLSVFNALQNASYLQSQQQAMQENQQIRREQLATDQARLEESKRQHEFQKTQLVLENPDKFPQETVLGAYNTMNQLSGGKHAITKTDLDTFNTDMTKFLNEVRDAPDVDAGNMVIQRYQERAATHPLFNQAFNRYLPMARDRVTRKGLHTLLEAQGITDERLRTRLTNDLTTEQAQELVKDDKRMDLIRYQQAQQINYRFQTDPDKVSDADLMTMLGTLRAQGVKPTEKGDAILKPRDMAAYHQEAASDLNQAKRDLQPLIEATAGISDADRTALFEAKNEIKTFAGTYPGSSIAANDFTLGKVTHENDAVTRQQQILSKYPQLQQTLKEVGPIAIQKATQYDELMAQYERDKRLLKLKGDPDMAAQLERLDEKMNALKVQAGPYKQIAHWAKNPDSPEALKGVLGVNGALNKALENAEARQQEFMTEAEKNARDQRREQGVKLHVQTIGPAEVEFQTMQWLAENPNATDQQIMGKAAEFGGEYKKRTGYMPDLKEATTRLVAQRTKQESDTLTKLTPEQAFKYETAVTGQENVEALIREIAPGGQVDNTKVATLLAGGLPFTEGRTLQVYIKDALDAEYRARTGAAMPDSEWDRAQDTFVPKITDPDATKVRKLEALLRHFDNKVNLIDPRGELKGRIKGRRTIQEVAGAAPATTANPPAERSFDQFKSWYQQNKGKFASPEEAAQAYHRGG
jgi:hypothetical protein